MLIMTFEDNFCFPYTEVRRGRERDVTVPSRASREEERMRRGKGE
jgi:hypothetical protein